MIETGIIWAIASAFAAGGAIFCKAISMSNQIDQINESIRLQEKEFLDSWSHLGINVWRTSEKMVQWICPECDCLTNSRYSSLYSHLKCCNCREKYFRRDILEIQENLRIQENLKSQKNICHQDLSDDTEDLLIE